LVYKIISYKFLFKKLWQHPTAIWMELALIMLQIF
jgi:hypothetical protein